MLGPGFGSHNGSEASELPRGRSHFAVQLCLLTTALSAQCHPWPCPSAPCFCSCSSWPFPSLYLFACTTCCAAVHSVSHCLLMPPIHCPRAMTNCSPNVMTTWLTMMCFQTASLPSHFATVLHPGRKLSSDRPTLVHTERHAERHTESGIHNNMHTYVLQAIHIHAYRHTYIHTATQAYMQAYRQL